MKVLNREMLREISKTKSKFLSILIIMFLGVFVFVGLKETTPAMINTYNKTLEEHNMYDIRVKNDFGLNEGDIVEIKKINNISNVETYYSKNYKIENSLYSLNMESLPLELATPKLLKGNLPENDKEIVLVDSLETEYKIGDIIKLSDDNNASKKLKNYEYRIVGFVHGADHIEVSSNNPTNIDYFAYVKKENFDFDVYTGANIKLKNINYKYSEDNYLKEVNKKRDELITLLEQRKKTNEENYKKETAQKLKSSEDSINEADRVLKQNEERVQTLKNLDSSYYEEQSAKLREGREQLENNKKQLEISKRAFSETSYPRFNVESIRGLVNYAQFIDSAFSLSFVANVFSIFLFTVSILVSLTTLTRMIDENRTNIGTLKALGYKNIEIGKKYYIYGGISTIIGTILGVVGAYLVIVPIIYNSYARFFTLKEPILVYSPSIIILAFLIAILCIFIAIYVPLRKNLKENSATLLRPKAPKGGSRIFLEKINFIWSRLSFLRKVTFRNIFRYKVRMFMTVFGVLGCLALMFIGFGIRFGVVNISNEQFKVINKIDILATYNPYINNEDIERIQNDIEKSNDVVRYSKVNVQKATIENNNEVLDTTQLVTLNRENYKEYITLLSGDNAIELPKNSVVINEKLAYLHKVKAGDLFKIIVNEKEYEVKIGAINKNYFGHIIYMDQQYYEELFDKNYSDNSFFIKLDSTEKVGEFARELEENSNIINVSDNSKIQENLDNFIKGIDVIVIVMVLCSLTLALVVLYNLINVNVSERIRELSTIKVLGFYPKEVTVYIFREVFYLSIVGIVLGNYLAYQMYLKIILELAARNMMFSSKVPIIVYLLASGITISIIAFVMGIMHRRLKGVNMVESLKAVE